MDITVRKYEENIKGPKKSRTIALITPSLGLKTKL